MLLCKTVGVVKLTKYTRVQRTLVEVWDPQCRCWFDGGIYFTDGGQMRFSGYHPVHNCYVDGCILLPCEDVGQDLGCLDEKKACIVYEIPRECESDVKPPPLIATLYNLPDGTTRRTRLQQPGSVSSIKMEWRGPGAGYTATWNVITNDWDMQYNDFSTEACVPCQDLYEGLHETDGYSDCTCSGSPVNSCSNTFWTSSGCGARNVHAYAGVYYPCEDTGTSKTANGILVRYTPGSNLLEIWATLIRVEQCDPYSSCLPCVYGSATNCHTRPSDCWCVQWYGQFTVDAWWNIPGTYALNVDWAYKHGDCGDSLWQFCDTGVAANCEISAYGITIDLKWGQKIGCWRQDTSGISTFSGWRPVWPGCWYENTDEVFSADGGVGNEGRADAYRYVSIAPEYGKNWAGALLYFSCNRRCERRRRPDAARYAAVALRFVAFGPVCFYRNDDPLSHVCCMRDEFLYGPLAVALVQ